MQVYDPDPNPCGLTPSEAIAMYDSRHRPFEYTVCGAKNTMKLTHSSYWLSRVKKEIENSQDVSIPTEIYSFALCIPYLFFSSCFLRLVMKQLMHLKGSKYLLVALSHMKNTPIYGEEVDFYFFVYYYSQDILMMILFLSFLIFL